MAPRNTGAPDIEPDHSIIHSHRSKGLGIFDKSQVFHQLSNFNIKFVSELKDPRMDLMGYLWALKVHMYMWHFSFEKLSKTFPHFLQSWRYFLWHLDLIKFGNSFPHILQFQECKIIWETNCKGFPYLLQLWRFILWHFNLRYFEMAFHIYCNSRYDNRKLFKVYPSGEISYVFISDKCMQKPFLVVRSIQLQLGEGRARVWLNLGKFAK